MFKEVSGYRIPDGLVIHQEESKKWTLSDLATGLKISGNYNSVQEASESANRCVLFDTIIAARKEDRYRVDKAEMLQYVLSLKEEDRVKDWQKYYKEEVKIHSKLIGI